MSDGTNRRFFGQFAWVTSGRIVAALLQALSLILIARFVDPSEFGTLSAVLGLATVAQTAIDMGVGTYITRERAASPDSGGIATALRFNMLTSLVLTALVLGALTAVGVLLDPVYYLMLPLAFWVSGERNADARLAVVFADGDVWINVVNLLARRTVGILLFLALALAGVEALLAYCLAVAVAALLSSGFANLYVRRRVTVPASISYRQLVHESTPYWINSVATQARNLDVTIAGIFAGSVQAGFYATASRLTSPLRILPTSLASVLLPAASRASARSHSLKPLLKVVVAVIGLMTVLYGIIFLLMPWIVPFALGDAYSDAVPTIQTVLVGLPFAAATSLFSSLLQGQGLKKFVATSASISTVACLVLVAILAPVWGSLGAGLALSISFVAQAVILIARFVRTQTRPTGETP